MKQEEDKKAKGLNDEEKKQLYFEKIATLERKVYDKSYINDNDLDFGYLTDPKTYRVKG
jgi:hypothetical protein